VCDVAKKSSDLDEWMTALPSRCVKCPVCLDEKARAAVVEILEAMARLGRHDVSLTAILERLGQTLPRVTFKLSALRRHCADHERERWCAAKGR
jgi:hypothetical protein